MPRFLKNFSANLSRIHAAAMLFFSLGLLACAGVTGNAGGESPGTIAGGGPEQANLSGNQLGINGASSIANNGPSAVAAAQPGLPTGLAGPDVDVGGDSGWYVSLIEGQILPSAAPSFKAAGAPIPNLKLKLTGTISVKDEITGNIVPVSNGRVVKIVNLHSDVAVDVLTVSHPITGEEGYFEAVVETPQLSLPTLNSQNQLNQFFSFFLGAKGKTPEPNPYLCSTQEPDCGKKDWPQVMAAWKYACPLLPCSND